MRFLGCIIKISGISLLNLLQINAQISISDNFDCTFSKEIVIPYHLSSDNKVSKPVLNQTVFYSYRDQFTYWYKIIVKENTELSFKVSAINDSDSYSSYVFLYNENDFCNKVYYQKIKPLKSSFFIGKNGNPDDKIYEKKFNALKDNTYYISVLNTSINNCGHHFTMIYGKDTLRVKAIHLPCKRDINVLVPKKLNLNAKADSLNLKTVAKPKTDSVKTKNNPVVINETNPDKNTPGNISCYVVDAKKETPIECKFVIFENDSKEDVEPEHPAKGKWNVTLDKQKNYKIKCSALGYKTNEQIVSAKNLNKELVIKMEALKEGDYFIMKSIYFHPNTYALKRESAEELNKLLSFLTDNEAVKIEIQGHTNGDNRIYKNKAYEKLGEEWNFSGSAKTLSQKRAEAIADYLITNSVPTSRVVPVGYGGKKPIIKDPQTMEEGQQNIRVEIVILKN